MTKTWQDYFDPIIEVRKKLDNPNESPLLKVINSGRTESLQRLIEKIVKDVKNVEQIFKITTELKNNDCDERIDDMVGELRGAVYLINKGHLNIEYHKNIVDFTSMFDNKKYAIEVKFLRGPDFKNQEQIGPNLAYELNSEPVKENLKNKVEHGYTQIYNFQTTHSDYQGIIVIVTNRLELDKFYFEKDIDKFRKQIETEKNMKIVILTNDDIYE